MTSPEKMKYIEETWFLVSRDLNVEDGWERKEFSGSKRERGGGVARDPTELY